MARIGLPEAIDILDTGSRSPVIPDDPYHLVLYELAGSLVDDERRAELFARLMHIAPSPLHLASADHDRLFAIARDGGMRPQTRVERWRTVAAIVIERAGGDLLRTLQGLESRKRRKLIGLFPTLGDPGVDKVLLFCGIEAVPTLDSNALRVLERLGFVEAGDYTKQYRTARALLLATYGADRRALERAYYVLRTHGKTVCRRSAAELDRCPLHGLCR